MIEYQVLGKPGQDQALWVQLSWGQGMHHFLFDCGENTIDTLSHSEVRDLDTICFSHLHMDHIAGFDSLFRQIFARDNKPNCIFGPPETIRILGHRFQGFLWNVEDLPDVTWNVTDLHPEVCHRAEFNLKEHFKTYHVKEYPRKPLIDHPHYTLDAFEMDHNTPSIAYLLRTKPKYNVNLEAVKARGLTPGPWIARLKQGESVDGHAPEDFLIQQPGLSIAYCTDFFLDEADLDRLSVFLANVDVLVCECQYKDEDASLAFQHRHMHSSRVAELAQKSNVGTLVPIHFSSRYDQAGWDEICTEVSSVFPKTLLPNGNRVRI